MFGKGLPEVPEYAAMQCDMMTLILHNNDALDNHTHEQPKYSPRGTAWVR